MNGHKKNEVVETSSLTIIPDFARYTRRCHGACLVISVNAKATSNNLSCKRRIRWIESAKKKTPIVPIRTSRLRHQICWATRVTVWRVKNEFSIVKRVKRTKTEMNDATSQLLDRIISSCVRTRQRTEFVWPYSGSNTCGHIQVSRAKRRNANYNDFFQILPWIMQFKNA